MIHDQGKHWRTAADYYVLVSKVALAVLPLNHSWSCSSLVTGCGGQTNEGESGSGLQFEGMLTGDHPSARRS